MPQIVISLQEEIELIKKTNPIIKKSEAKIFKLFVEIRSKLGKDINLVYDLESEIQHNRVLIADALEGVISKY